MEQVGRLQTMKQSSSSLPCTQIFAAEMQASDDVFSVGHIDLGDKEVI